MKLKLSINHLTVLRLFFTFICSQINLQLETVRHSSTVFNRQLNKVPIWNVRLALVAHISETAKSRRNLIPFIFFLLLFKDHVNKSKLYFSLKAIQQVSLFNIRATQEIFIAMNRLDIEFALNIPLIYSNNHDLNNLSLKIVQIF